MSILFLVGARASGKTTIGKALARSLGLPFADTDQHLLHRAGLTVEQIVAAEGWPGFRSRESQALQEVADAHPAGCVVSTGGGMVPKSPASGVCAIGSQLAIPLVQTSVP